MIELMIEWTESPLWAAHPFSHHSIHPSAHGCEVPVLQMSSVKASCREVLLAKLMNDRVGFWVLISFSHPRKHL